MYNYSYCVEARKYHNVDHNNYVLIIEVYFEGVPNKEICCSHSFSVWINLVYTAKIEIEVNINIRHIKIIQKIDADRHMYIQTSQ